MCCCRREDEASARTDEMSTKVEAELQAQMADKTRRDKDAKHGAWAIKDIGTYLLGTLTERVSREKMTTLTPGAQV